MELPDYADLPDGKAWDLWNSINEKDQYGCLNLLTPDVIARAASEISTGERCVLNWDLRYPVGAAKGRAPCPYEMHTIVSLKPNFTAFDDILAINTQVSSQIDGFRHWANQKAGVFYNGVTEEEIKSSPRNGVHAWSQIGGIAGRGVLLDFVKYAQDHGIKYDPKERGITLDEIKDMAREEGVLFRIGDLLLIRTGYVKWHNEASHEERLAGTAEHTYGGPIASAESIEWIWNNHFAMVAGDTPAFENIPNESGYLFHNSLLVDFGVPIGELWDLEALSQLCATNKRYTFFLTSTPLNLYGGVATISNAMAIF